MDNIEKNDKRNKIVAFATKVSKNKTHNDKDYFVFRVTIPKKDAEKLSLSNEDHLLVFAEKAKWYHMLDWNKMPETYAKLPNKIKKEVRELGLFKSSKKCIKCVDIVQIPKLKE